MRILATTGRNDPFRALGDADEKLDHGRSGVGVDAFMAELDGYMEYYCEGRIKESLGWMSPNEYRRSLGYSS